MADQRDWANGVGAYTEQHWDADMRAPACSLEIPGTPPVEFCALACPVCATIGFYGPRQAPGPGQGPVTRKYRACKFCGLWQEAWGDVYDERGGTPYRCMAFVCERCQCRSWRDPQQPGNEPCPACHIDMTPTTWAVDDPTHPFWPLVDLIAQALRQHGKR
jgi:hypothetical protein